MPFLSIISATFNAADSLRHCFDSLASQSVPVEHVLIDGGSSDGTLGIIEAHKADIAQFVSEPDNGIYDAMNKGISKAQGEIIGILNADDFFSSSNILSKVVRTFENPEIDACYGDLCYVDAKNTKQIIRYWRAGNFRHSNFKWGWMPPHPTFFVRRSVYEKYGLFNLDLGSAADYELMLRFLYKHRIKCAYIPETLVNMRTGGVSNASLRNRLAANRMDRKAWEVNGLTPYPWTLWMKPLRKLPQYFLRPYLLIYQEY